MVITAIAIFVFSDSVFPQDSTQVDSLQNILSATDIDTSRVKMLMSFSRLYIGNDEKKVASYLQSALKLSVKLSYNRGISKSLSQLGTHYFRIAKYSDAITASLKAANIFYRTGDDNGLAYAISNIGNVYFKMEEFEKALSCQFFALKLHRKMKSERAVASTMNIIGTIYQDLGHLDDALTYYESSLDIHKRLNNQIAMARTYDYMGTLFEEDNDTTGAFEYFSMAERIYKKRRNNSGSATNLYNLGNVFLAKKNYPKAAEYFKKSIELAEISEAKETLGDAYYNLAWVYEKMQNYEDALKYYKLYNNNEDSVFDAGKHELMDMQFNLQSERKESLIELQRTELENKKLEIQKQNTQVIAMALGVLLLIAFSILAYSSYKRKKKDHDLIVIEKKKSEDLLLNILPEEIAEELKEYGKSQAKKFDFVSVLFADFKEFSKFAGMVEPEEVVQELDDYFRAFDSIVHKYDIEKIKTIGDAYMCAGGIPAVNNTNPVDIVNCGIEMRNFVLEYNEKKRALNQKGLGLRIGIHTGPVVAGIVGVKKFSYDIWGDTVNIASRLQSAGVEGKVNISEATYQHVKEHFRCEYRGKLPAKNIGDVDMYFVEPSG